LETLEQIFVEVDVAPDGSTFFRQTQISVNLTNFSPPAPEIFASRITGAETARILALPAGWNSDWHCSPMLQLMTPLSGRVQIEVSTGEMRQFKTGDLLLLKDVNGRGHRSSALGQEGVTLLTIQLPSVQPISFT
jgi:hypothetical protein